jgi:hypothetical protein
MFKTKPKDKKEITEMDIEDIEEKELTSQDKIENIENIEKVRKEKDITTIEEITSLNIKKREKINKMRLKKELTIVAQVHHHLLNLETSEKIKSKNFKMMDSLLLENQNLKLEIKEMYTIINMVKSIIATITVQINDLKI